MRVFANRFSRRVAFASIAFTLVFLLSHLIGVEAVSATYCPAACPVGYYNIDNSLPCAACTAGSSCAGGCTAQPIACPSGQYSDVAAASCTPCPAGSSCGTPSAAPILCAVGTFAAGSSLSCSSCAAGTYANVTGAATCNACPPGSQCLDPTATPATCPAGTYSTGSATSCTTCPAGSYSAAGASSCLTCPAGSYCFDPTQSPTACPANYYSSATNSTACVTCPAGYTPASGQTSCANCPAGFQCPGSGASPSACPSGTYNLGLTPQSSCTQCPAGSSCATASGSPAACAAGTYAIAGSSSCSTCPAGFACSTSAIGSACTAGQYWIAASGTCANCLAGSYCPSPASTLITCPSGYYSLASAQSCTQCPAGSRCTTTAVTACGSGQYAAPGSTACTNCPAGFACPTGASSPQACSPGYISAGTVQTCSACASGSYCPTALPASAAACPSGYYSTGGAVACSPCPPGSACAASSGSTTACPAGQYNAGGAAGCTTCAAGYMCPYPDQNVAIECPAGYYSLAGNATCTYCPAGYFCATPATAPVACTSGYSVGGQTSCTTCPAGYTCSSTSLSTCTLGQYSAVGSTSCTNCPAGYACPSPSLPPYPCLAGTYSPGNLTACLTCPVGTQCPLTAGLSIGPLSNCTAGYYRFDLTINTCTQCPAGYYCFDGMQYPQPCPTGYTSALGQASCTACPVGWGCGSPITSNPANTVCAAGSFSVGGQISCTPCPSGMTCAPGSANATAPCPVGFYCPRGPGAGNYPGTPCPAGTFLNTTGASFVTDCNPCPANYSCPSGSGTIIPQACAAGHFCPSGTRSATQFPCLPGTYLPATQLQRASRADCQECPQGYYCDIGTSVPVPCVGGTYCPAGSSSSTATACPLGTYLQWTGATAASNCTSCPIGAYCPYGASAPVPCPPGSYNPNANSYLAANCVPCDAGKSCSTFGLSAPNGVCQVGHYCPPGTVMGTDTSCPAGTYTDSTSAVQLSDCTICPQGFACGFATGGAITKVACSPGHYCPAGTGSPNAYACPSGTYYAGTDATSVSSCTICPAGSFCEGGRGWISGSCSAGYYCPARTNSSTLYPCAAGSYLGTTAGTAQSDCTPCPQGSFCPTASASPIACSAGTYNPTLSATADGAIGTSLTTSSFPSCASCPAGYQCSTTGVVNPVACSAGYYSSVGSITCSPCPAGYFCSAGTMTDTQMLASPCPAGYSCSSGQSVGVTNPCPMGQYCPQGSSAPLNCPIGTYNPSTQSTSLAACQTCPAGYFCLEGSSGYASQCGTGYYCPSGSSSPNQVPCPEAYRRTTVGATAASDCENCPAGLYCPRGSGQGIQCPTGYYCPALRATPIPCPKGTYGNSTGLMAVTDCQACDGGSYCDQEGLSAPKGKCDPGYYCITAATSSQPANGPQGGICPAGGYCPQGSYKSLPCPAGTYQNVSGASDISLCQLCPPGFYCGSTSNAGPTGPCAAGFYCTGSSVTPYQFASPAGYYSLNGSSSATPCPVGTYAPGANSSSCLLCDAGFFCPNQSTIFITECPAGEYCLAGSSYPTACPSGTYNHYPQGKNITACVGCPAGSYCSGNGLTDVTGPCTAGFLCAGGSQIASPQSCNVGGYACPRSYYCPSGVPTPQPCPLGYYTTSTGSTSSSACVPCPPGKFCAQSTTTIPDCNSGAALSGSTPSDCTTGYYCLGGASVGAPTDGTTGNACPSGSACPPASVGPSQCLAGTFQNLTAQGGCIDCPAGSWCAAGAVAPTICPTGYYCPAKTQYASQFPCPIGTYGNTTGASSFGAGCFACPPGKYCASYHADNPTGLCTAGYYCPTLASDPYGTLNVTGSTAQLCPKGSYCPTGATTPLPCPPGTSLNATGGTDVTSCVYCPGGMYCGASGLIVPTGVCQAGYYCALNSTTATPQATAGLTITQAGGDICPAGFYCAAASPQPTPCPAGQFQNLTGKSSCNACPQGYYCPLGTAVPISCPQGYYCPQSTQGATDNPCPAGTYNSFSNRVSVTQCVGCPPGYYCTAGSPTPTAQCSGGYYCAGNNTIPNPITAFCGIGNYCPVGSSGPTPCDANTYCGSTTLSSPSGNCSAGWYCLSGATTSQPTGGATGGPCTTGNYCPGSSPIQPCPTGTFNPATRSTSISACLPCLGGYECSATGMSSSTVTPCRTGYYCPNGTATASQQCITGTYCPGGVSAPVPCAAGTYTNTVGQYNCSTCPAGYVCAGSGNITPAPCPVGSYCLAGTRLGNQYPCPPGFYNDQQQATNITYCKPCAGGYYCPNNGTTVATGAGPCSAGYYCEGGSYTPSPNALIITWNLRTYTNDLCLDGFYCPAGSNTSISCGAGTLASGRGKQSFSDCNNCPRGFYCNGAAGTTAKNPCDAGYLCISRAFISNPTDNTTGYACPAGSYSGIGALSCSPCSPGSLNANTGSASCVACTAGSYCSQYGMTIGVTCPLGSYCPAGTVQPRACPSGTIGTSTGLTASLNCTLCPQGAYCAGTNATSPTGSCAAGYYCDSGSLVAAPTGPSTLPGAGPKSGPCPAGNYCPAGTTSPMLCPIGTYLPSNQSASSASQCFQCTAGMYCATQGLSAPTGYCAPGFLCPAGSSSNITTQCPAGKFCNSASPNAQNCQDGTYTNALQQSTCAQCPVRKYCINSGIVPQDCPANFYCPLGTGQPIVCPLGTYSNVTGLASATECQICPAGEYCTNGVIQGTCSAGYICWSGSSVPQPAGNTTSGGLCPAGHWCADGTPTPTPCAADTLRRTPGASVVTDCLVCPIGYKCNAGDPNPIPCQVGFYCLADGSNVPCPVGTYNPTAAATNVSSCLTCPSGYRCDTEGTSDPTRYPCAPGYYCVGGLANATICPAGTYQPNAAATSLSACLSCSGGFTCAEGSVSQSSCQGGTYCPVNASFASPCPAQFYCPYQSAAPLPCPGGFYCPALATDPLLCPIGTYCNPMSSAPTACPLGYYSLSTDNRVSFNTSCASCPAGFYSTNASEPTCNKCDGGYVCVGGASTPTPVNPMQGGYICPVGYYCPNGTAIELPCPPGSYNTLTGQSSLSACLLCGANSFQDLSGQIGCKPCTASSSSPPGSSSCTCTGANRAFQASDQSCICQPGFEFISDAHRLSEEDDVVDCQPIILARCTNGKARDARGRCVKSDGEDCAATQCAGGTGKFSVPLGVCECVGQPSLDAVCGSDCRQQAPKLSFSGGKFVITDPTAASKGLNATSSFETGSIPGLIGSPDCSSGSCNFYSAVVRNGIGGQYGVPPTFASFAASTGQYIPTQSRHARHEYTMATSSGTERFTHHKFETEATTATFSAYNVINPAVICLVAGEGLLFDVSDAVDGHYPVYQKDNLLNSNPGFDYGYFRNLSTAISSNASAVQLFAFTFTTAGVYVFTDNVLPDQYTVIRVVDVNQICPTPNSDPLSRIQPFQFDALISNGVQRNQNVVISPDWGLLGIMIALIFCLVVLVVIGLYFFQTHSWGSGLLVKPKYKDIALQESLDVWTVFSTKGTVRSVDNVSKGLVSLAGSDPLKEALASKASGLKSRKRAADEADGEATGLASTASDGLSNLMNEWEDANLGTDPNDAWMNELSSHLDLEGFDFHSLYKMLDETKASVEGYFEHQEDGLKTFYERMAMEIDHLKNVLAVKMQVQLNKTGEGMSEAVDRLVSGELLARQAFQDLSRRRELELTKTLEQLVTCIRNLNEDYNIFPIKELVRLTNEHIIYCERGLEQERNRRKIFASHTEIVGRPIIDALSKADMNEEGVQDQYMDALKLFETSVQELLKKMLIEEQNHAGAMEKLDESSTDKRTLELNRFHLAICKLAKEIQQQLSYLDENLTPIFEALREMEDKTHHVWVHVQGDLLEKRWEQLLHPTEGRLFRGINPELAKVLTGLLGMKGGLSVDPLTGTFQPKTPFDPTDPFDTIFDYQAAQAAADEEAELDSDSDDEGEGRRKKKKKKGGADSGAGTSRDGEDADGTKRGGEDSDEDGENADGTTRGDGESGEAGDENTTAGGDDLDENDVHARAINELKAKRKAIEEDESLTEDERALKLAALDAELDALRKLFGKDADNLVDAFKRSQAGRNEEIDEDDAEIQRLKDELLAKHAELQKLESTHSAEEEALIRQMDREDAEAAENFAVDMSKFDSLLQQIDNEDAETAAKRRKAAASGSNDVKEYREASSTLLNEYEFIINDMRGGGASEEKIKEKVAEMHAAKRAELREKRLAALRKKQEAEAEQLRQNEEEAKEKLQDQIKDNAELQSVLDVIKSTDKAVPAGAAGSSEPGAAGEGGVTGGEVGGVAVPVDPNVAAEFERERESIERRYKRQQLEREARNAVMEAFEYAKLEFRQDNMLQNRLKAKTEQLSANDDGKETTEAVKDLLKGVDADRANLMNAEEAEKARQRKKLQERLAAQKKNQADKVSKKKELELRAASRQLEAANKGNVRVKEQEKIVEAINKLPEKDRRKLGKKVVELVMNPRHNRELENVMADHAEERQAFVLEAMEAAQAEGKPINFMEIEHQAAEKFEAKHAQEVADLIKAQHNEVRESYGKVFPDESFEGPEWEMKEGDALAEYQRRRREIMQRKAAAGESEGVSDNELAKLAEEAAAKQRAHELRLKAEQDEFDRMQREFDEKEEARKKKRAQLEEEAKKRELDLLEDLSEAQRSDILNQHRLNLKNFERATDNERVRQANLLEKSLEDRRKKMALLKAKRKAQIEKDKLLEKQMKKRLKKKMIKKLKDESVSGAGELWKLRAAAGAGALMPGGVVAGGDSDDGNDSDDGVTRHKKRLAKDESERQELAQKQEVIARLKTIEGMVDKLNQQSDAWRGQIYVDEKDSKDAAFQPVGTEVGVCNVSELDPKSLVLYRFAVNLMNLLYAKGLAKSPVTGTNTKQANTPVHLLLASTLPPNLHQQTAFKNSFHFDAERSILFLRKQRLEDVGEFLLLLTHCLAHISTSACQPNAGVQKEAGSDASPVGVVEGWDDRNPAFVQAFHSLLKFICADIFYANASKALDAAPHILPLVHPMSSPAAIEGEQIEGGSSSSSSSSSSKVPSVPGLSASDAEAWLGSSVRQVAIDELLDFHPLSAVDGASASGNSMAGVYHSHHSSEFAASRMLERLHDYSAFAHATALKNNLVELEKNVRAREHARELKEVRSFRQRAVRGMPPPTQPEDKSWASMNPRSGQEFGADKLHDIEDELTAELSSIVDQLYQHTHALHQTERDIKDLKAKSSASAADSAAVTKHEASANNERAVIAQLNKHKDNCIYRLRNVHAATQQVEGDQPAQEE